MKKLGQVPGFLHSTNTEATHEKRLGLVRKILISVADLPDFNSTVRPDDLEGHQKDEVSYHISIMRQAGFLSASCVDFHDTGMYCIAQQLTWEGQELLSKIREQGAWNKVKGCLLYTSEAETVRSA